MDNILFFKQNIKINNQMINSASRDFSYSCEYTSIVFEDDNYNIILGVAKSNNIIYDNCETSIIYDYSKHLKYITKINITFNGVILLTKCGTLFLYRYVHHRKFFDKDTTIIVLTNVKDFFHNHGRIVVSYFNNCYEYRDCHGNCYGYNNFEDVKEFYYNYAHSIILHTNGNLIYGNKVISHECCTISCTG